MSRTDTQSDRWSHADVDPMDPEYEELYRLIDRILALVETEPGPVHVRLNALVCAAGLAAIRVAAHNPLVARRLGLVMATYAADVAPGTVIVTGLAPSPGTH